MKQELIVFFKDMCNVLIINMKAYVFFLCINVLLYEFTKNMYIKHHYRTCFVILVG